MRISSKAQATFLALTASILPAAAQSSGANVYVQINLVSNLPTAAPITDPNLVDPWGISFSGTSPFWVSDHLSGKSTLYNGGGAVNATVVKIPAGSASGLGALGKPTGQVQNNLSTSGVTPVPGATYTFTTADNFGDLAFNQLLGINNSGTIAGYFGDGSVVPNFGYTLVPFTTFKPNVYANENYPGSVQTQVIGVNNSDPGSPAASATVGFYIDANDNNIGFANLNGTFAAVANPNTPSGSPTTNQLLGVNDAGLAAGFYLDGNGNAQGYVYNILSKTFTAVTLPASFGAVATTATGINNAGTISGFYVDGSGNTHGFFGSGTTFTQLDNPNGSGTFAFGLNNEGQVVGSYTDMNGVSQGFIYFTASKMWQTISDPYASANPAFDVTGTLVNGINDFGEIVGFYSDGTNVNGFYASAPGEAPTPFLLPAPNGKTASFIFDTDDGTISAWNGSVVASTAVITVDNSASKAVYKALAIGTSAVGPTLYAANFRSGKIEAYNGSWAPAAISGKFIDPAVPAGFAPFNIRNIGGQLYVTYAKQDANQFLDVAGPGNGYVAVFDLNGNLLTHLISGGVLNSPWGVAIAPANWGAFGSALLVGNFGDGTINAFNATTGAQLGTLLYQSGSPVVLPGLWAIAFGNGGNGGDTNTLYFCAGTPNGFPTPRGILGAIAPPAAIKSIVNAASELAGSVAPGEIVLIGGQSVGPSPSVTSSIPAPGGKLPFATNPTNPVNATNVTFNGIAAPIVYAGSAGTAVQVPYEITGASSASVVMNVGSQTTSAFSVPVAPTAPGLFTINFTGQGQVVALNADGTVNSSANPAARGSTIMLFATGEGLTVPADTDGIGEANNTFVPSATVSVTFSGVAATLGSDTSFPKDVSGVLELTVTIPSGISAGASTVVLTAGGTATTQPTSVYVK